MYWYNPTTCTSQRVEAPSTDEQAIKMLAGTKDSAEFIKRYLELRRSGRPIEQALVLVGHKFRLSQARLSARCALAEKICFEAVGESPESVARKRSKEPFALSRIRSREAAEYLMTFSLLMAWRVTLLTSRVRRSANFACIGFSEVRIAPVQHLEASRHRTGSVCCPFAPFVASKGYTFLKSPAS